MPRRTEAFSTLRRTSRDVTISWLVPALRRLLANGVSLRPFPNEVMQACYKAANEVFDETMEKNAAFKKVFVPWKKFRDEEDLWFSVAEKRFDDFMITATRQVAANK